ATGRWSALASAPPAPASAPPSRTPRAQPGRRKAASLRRPLRLRDQRPQRAGVERPDELVDDAPGAVDEERLGNAEDAVGDGGLRLGIDERGIGAPAPLAQERLRLALLVLVDDAEELHVAHLVRRRRQRGVLLDAGNAPG